MNIEELFWMSYYLGEAYPYSEHYQDEYDFRKDFPNQKYTKKRGVEYYYPH